MPSCVCKTKGINREQHKGWSRTHLGTVAGEKGPNGQHQWAKLWSEVFCDATNDRGHSHGFVGCVVGPWCIVLFEDSTFSNDEYGNVMGSDHGVDRLEIAEYGPVIEEPQ